MGVQDFAVAGGRAACSGSARSSAAAAAPAAWPGCRPAPPRPRRRVAHSSISWRKNSSNRPSRRRILASGRRQLGHGRLGSAQGLEPLQGPGLAPGQQEPRRALATLDGRGGPRRLQQFRGGSYAAIWAGSARGEANQAARRPPRPQLPRAAPGVRVLPRAVRRPLGPFPHRPFRVQVQEIRREIAPGFPPRRRRGRPPCRARATGPAAHDRPA